MDEYKDLPNLTFSGATWDANHLSNFLSSKVGGKLYNTTIFNTSPMVSAEHLPPISMFSTIKPSNSFISQSRDNEKVSIIDKPQGNSLVNWVPNKYSSTLKNPDIIQISQQLVKIEEEKKEIIKESGKIIPPSKRKQLFEAEKHRNKVHSDLKTQKLLILKKQRIIKGEYPLGILGIDSPSRPDKSPNYSLLQLKDQKKIQEDGLKRRFRAQNIITHTSPSPNFQFFNETSVSPELEKPRGLKKVEILPSNFHNTHASLFESKPRPLPIRKWQDKRDFNIISGVKY